MRKEDIMGILNWLVGGGLIFALIAWWIELLRYL